MFQVITKINEGDAGNLASAIDLRRVVDEGDASTDYQERTRPVIDFGLRYPVFSLSEIIVVDSSGREIGGWERKASKWLVGYETFSELADAIACSKKVMEA